MKAVIVTGGKQYTVAEGDVLYIEKLEAEAESTVKFDQVLAVLDGENSKIGAGSVVLEEVPPNCTVVGVPGRIVRRENKKVPRSDMDQVHLPDPVLSDIRELQEENRRLHKELEDLIKNMRCMGKGEKRHEDL